MGKGWVHELNTPFLFICTAGNLHYGSSSMRDHAACTVLPVNCMAFFAGLECECPCVNHEGKEVLNDIFPMSVDQVFTLIFTGSKFYNDLLESRKTYGRFLF